MNYLKITNKGLLDIRLFSLMGGTTKENDSTKIGQWGSGLKYAISFLLRNSINFKILIGKKEVRFSIKKEEVRGETFEVIVVNEEPTSLTTKMGGDAWTEWACLRELYSNALDEGGAKIKVTDSTETEEDETSFFVELTPGVLTVYNNWDKYFLINKVPMYENDNFKLYPNGGNLKLYKQGVLIGERKEKSLFLYDFKHASINELREYRGVFDNDLSKILYEIDDVKTIHYIVKNITEDVYEGQIDFSVWRSATWEKPNDAWKKAFGNAKIITKEIKEKCQASRANVNLAHTITLPDNLYKGLNHYLPDISAVKIADKTNEFYEIDSPNLEVKVLNAINLLKSKGYILVEGIKFLYGEFGKDNVLAKVDTNTKEVMLSLKLKNKSVFDVCSTLIEENEHIRTGLHDESREFQQHFIDLYTSVLLGSNNTEYYSLN